MKLEYIKGVKNPIKGQLENSQINSNKDSKSDVTVSMLYF